MSTPARENAACRRNIAVLLCALATALPAADAPKNAEDRALCSGSACAQGKILPRRLTIETSEGRLASDLYLPPQDIALRGGTILAHGFLRPRLTMQDHAAALAARGVVSLVPKLPYQTDPAGNARALRELSSRMQQGQLGPAVAHIVLVGFSAGALAAVMAAPELPGLAGLVALDPFDRPSQPGLTSARRIAVPTTVIRAPPAACNGYGRAATWAGALPRLDRDVLIPKATHCDFEAPTTLACRMACFGSEDARRASIQQSLQSAVERYLPKAEGQ